MLRFERMWASVFKPEEQEVSQFRLNPSNLSKQSGKKDWEFQGPKY